MIAINYKPPQRSSWPPRYVELPRHTSRDHVRVSQEHYDLDLVDKKGRAIGALVTVTESTVALASPNGSWRPSVAKYPLGTKLRELSVHATRNGTPFGASPNSYLAGDAADPKTQARIDAEILRRLNAMQKRYAKQIEKGRV